MYRHIKDILALIGACVVAWYILSFLVDAGILHIAGQ